MESETDKLTSRIWDSLRECRAEIELIADGEDAQPWGRLLIRQICSLVLYEMDMAQAVANREEDDCA